MWKNWLIPVCVVLLVFVPIAVGFLRWRAAERSARANWSRYGASLDRKATSGEVGRVRVLPLIPVVLVICLIFAFMTRDLWLAALSPAVSASSSDLRGEWVGAMQVQRGATQRQAVIRFTLKMTDGFLKKYGGVGEMAIEGEAQPRRITLSQFYLRPNRADGSYTTGLTCEEDRGDPGKSDEVTGDFKGVFTPGSLLLERDETTGYAMKGTLAKGTDADYLRLLHARLSGEDSKPHP